jgi:hypothetical protein
MIKLLVTIRSVSFAYRSLTFVKIRKYPSEPPETMSPLFKTATDQTETQG